MSQKKNIFIKKEKHTLNNMTNHSTVLTFLQSRPPLNYWLSRIRHFIISHLFILSLSLSLSLFSRKRIFPKIDMHFKYQYVTQILIQVVYIFIKHIHMLGGSSSSLSLLFLLSSSWTFNSSNCHENICIHENVETFLSRDFVMALKYGVGL